MTCARLLTVSSLALLAACAQQQVPKHVALANQRDCPLRLHSGQTLSLTLPSDPTTGYRWQVKNAGQPVLRSLGPEVYSNPEDAGLVGAAGQSVWRFATQQAGTGSLSLVYQQPWAPEVVPVKSFDCALSMD